MHQLDTVREDLHRASEGHRRSPPILCNLNGGEHRAVQADLCVAFCVFSRSLRRTSFRVKCRVNGFEQSRVAEWFEQTLYCTLCEHLGPNSLFSLSGDEDNRNLSLAKLKFPLQLRSAHSRHGNVEDQATSLVKRVGRKKLLRGGECMGCKAELAEEVGQRFADRLVVIND